MEQRTLLSPSKYLLAGIRESNPSNAEEWLFSRSWRVPRYVSDCDKATWRGRCGPLYRPFLFSCGGKGGGARFWVRAGVGWGLEADQYIFAKISQKNRH